MSRMNEKLSKNFYRREFRCMQGEKPCSFCGGNAAVNERLVTLVQAVRDEVGHALKVSSGFRCVRKNSITPGAVDGSFHTTGQAADVFSPSTSAAIIYAAALRVIKRLGFGYAILYSEKNFVHLDVGKR